MKLLDVSGAVGPLYGSLGVKGLITEVCHPRSVFKLYGEVNSVTNTTINICLNEKIHVSSCNGHLQVLTAFLL